MPNLDDPPPLVAPAIVVANVCFNLSSMTGAIFCWYFSAHMEVWGTGFFEGAFNIGGSLFVLGFLVLKRAPNLAKVVVSLAIFIAGLFINILVFMTTTYNLYSDILEDSKTSLVLKITGHVLTLFGSFTSSICLVCIIIKGIQGIIQIRKEPNREYGEAAFNYGRRQSKQQTSTTGTRNSFESRAKSASLFESETSSRTLLDRRSRSEERNVIPIHAALMEESETNDDDKDDEKPHNSSQDSVEMDYLNAYRKRSITTGPSDGKAGNDKPVETSGPMKRWDELEQLPTTNDESPADDSIVSKNHVLDEFSRSENWANSSVSRFLRNASQT